MLGTEDLEHIIKLVFFSGYIKDERPLSLLITAKVESGKTELVKKYIRNNGIAYMNDVTAYGIVKSLSAELKSGVLKHIVIPDLITPLSKQKSTVRSFIAFLNGLIEEGILAIQTYALNLSEQKDIRCGLVTTIAQEDLFDRRHQWRRMGFMSRVLPVSYSYSRNQAIKILESIAIREYVGYKSEKLKFPKKEKKIILPVKYSRAIMPYSVSLAEAQNLYGFRMQKHLQLLMMANALMNRRDTVNNEDLEKVKELTNYINLEYNPIPTKKSD